MTIVLIIEENRGLTLKLGGASVLIGKLFQFLEHNQSDDQNKHIDSLILLLEKVVLEAASESQN